MRAPSREAFRPPTSRSPLLSLSDRIGYSRTWSKRVAHAHCPTCHRSPGLNCGCGLYAHASYHLLRLPHNPTVMMFVAGKVRAWGKIAEHTTGFRAEHMEIVELYDESVGPSALP